MVMSLLLNSIAKDLVVSFLYVWFAREPWLELERRFGQSNGSLIYQLQHEIATISQGELNISQYFTKLKRLWDKLIYLMPVLMSGCNSNCVCDIPKKQVEKNETNRLMQFLMGLNDSYDVIQIKCWLWSIFYVVEGGETRRYTSYFKWNKH